MTPSDQVKTILLAASQAGARLFRMNVGLAWAGSKIKRIEQSGLYRLPAGALVIFDPRPFKAGVEGMSDTGGWLSITITPEMVGTVIAQHCAIEVKQGSGRPSQPQKAYIEAVRKAGGRAGVARSVQDALEILRGDGTTTAP